MTIPGWICVFGQKETKMNPRTVDQAEKVEHPVYTKGRDGSTYAIPPEVLEAFSLRGHVVVTIGNRSFAIPEVVLEQMPVADEDRDTVEDILSKQELPSQNGEELWNLVPYTACFYGAWAGGGDAVAASTYCEGKYPF